MVTRALKNVRKGSLNLMFRTEKSSHGVVKDIQWPEIQTVMDEDDSSIDNSSNDDVDISKPGVLGRLRTFLRGFASRCRRNLKRDKHLNGGNKNDEQSRNSVEARNQSLNRDGHDETEDKKGDRVPQSCESPLHGGDPEAILWENGNKPTFSHETYRQRIKDIDDRGNLVPAEHERVPHPLPHPVKTNMQIPLQSGSGHEQPNSRRASNSLLIPTETIKDENFTAPPCVPYEDIKKLSGSDSSFSSHTQESNSPKPSRTTSFKTVQKVSSSQLESDITEPPDIRTNVSQDPGKTPKYLQSGSDCIESSKLKQQDFIPENECLHPYKWLINIGSINTHSNMTKYSQKARTVPPQPLVGENLHNMGGKDHVFPPPFMPVTPRKTVKDLSEIPLRNQFPERHRKTLEFSRNYVQKEQDDLQQIVMELQATVQEWCSNQNKELCDRENEGVFQPLLKMGTSCDPGEPLKVFIGRNTRSHKLHGMSISQNITGKYSTDNITGVEQDFGFDTLTSRQIFINDSSHPRNAQTDKTAIQAMMKDPDKLDSKATEDNLMNKDKHIMNNGNETMSIHGDASVTENDRQIEIKHYKQIGLAPDTVVTKHDKKTDGDDYQESQPKGVEQTGIDNDCQTVTSKENQPLFEKNKQDMTIKDILAKEETNAEKESKHCREKEMSKGNEKGEKVGHPYVLMKEVFKIPPQTHSSESCFDFSIKHEDVSSKSLMLKPNSSEECCPQVAARGDHKWNEMKNEHLPEKLVGDANPFKESYFENKTLNKSNAQCDSVETERQTNNVMHRKQGNGKGKLLTEADVNVLGDTNEQYRVNKSVGNVSVGNVSEKPTHTTDNVYVNIKLQDSEKLSANTNCMVVNGTEENGNALGVTHMEVLSIDEQTINGKDLKDQSIPLRKDDMAYMDQKGPLDKEILENEQDSEKSLRKEHEVQKYILCGTKSIEHDSTNRKTGRESVKKQSLEAIQRSVDDSVEHFSSLNESARNTVGQHSFMKRIVIDKSFFQRRKTDNHINSRLNSGSIGSTKDSDGIGQERVSGRTNMGSKLEDSTQKTCELAEDHSTLKASNPTDDTGSLLREKSDEAVSTCVMESQSGQKQTANESWKNTGRAQEIKSRGRSESGLKMNSTEVTSCDNNSRQSFVEPGQHDVSTATTIHQNCDNAGNLATMLELANDQTTIESDYSDDQITSHDTLAGEYPCHSEKEQTFSTSENPQRLPHEREMSIKQYNSSPENDILLTKRNRITRPLLTNYSRSPVPFRDEMTPHAERESQTESPDSEHEKMCDNPGMNNQFNSSMPRINTTAALNERRVVIKYIRQPYPPEGRPLSANVGSFRFRKIQGVYGKLKRTKSSQDLRGNEDDIEKSVKYDKSNEKDAIFNKTINESQKTGNNFSAKKETFGLGRSGRMQRQITDGNKYQGIMHENIQRYRSPRGIKISAEQTTEKRTMNKRRTVSPPRLKFNCLKSEAELYACDTTVPQKNAINVHVRDNDKNHLNLTSKSQKDDHSQVVETHSSDIRNNFHFENESVHSQISAKSEHHSRRKDENTTGINHHDITQEETDDAHENMARSLNQTTVHKNSLTKGHTSTSLDTKVTGLFSLDTVIGQNVVDGRKIVLHRTQANSKEVTLPTTSPLRKSNDSTSSEQIHDCNHDLKDNNASKLLSTDRENPGGTKVGIPSAEINEGKADSPSQRDESVPIKQISGSYASSTFLNRIMSARRSALALPSRFKSRSLSNNSKKREANKLENDAMGPSDLDVKNGLSNNVDGSNTSKGENKRNLSRNKYSIRRSPVLQPTEQKVLNKRQTVIPSRLIVINKYREQSLYPPSLVQTGDSTEVAQHTETKDYSSVSLSNGREKDENTVQSQFQTSRHLALDARPSTGSFDLTNKMRIQAGYKNRVKDSNKAGDDENMGRYLHDIENNVNESYNAEEDDELRKKMSGSPASSKFFKTAMSERRMLFPSRLRGNIQNAKETYQSSVTRDSRNLESNDFQVEADCSASDIEHHSSNESQQLNVEENPLAASSILPEASNNDVSMDGTEYNNGTKTNEQITLPLPQPREDLAPSPFPVNKHRLPTVANPLRETVVPFQKSPTSPKPRAPYGRNLDEGGDKGQKPSEGEIIKPIIRRPPMKAIPTVSKKIKDFRLKQKMALTGRIHHKSEENLKFFRNISKTTSGTVSPTGSSSTTSSDSSTSSGNVRIRLGFGARLRILFRRLTSRFRRPRKRRRLYPNRLSGISLVPNPSLSVIMELPEHPEPSKCQIAPSPRPLSPGVQKIIDHINAVKKCKSISPKSSSHSTMDTNGKESNSSSAGDISSMLSLSDEDLFDIVTPSLRSLQETEHITYNTVIVPPDQMTLETTLEGIDIIKDYCRNSNAKEKSTDPASALVSLRATEDVNIHKTDHPEEKSEEFKSSIGKSVHFHNRVTVYTHPSDISVQGGNGECSYLMEGVLKQEKEGIEVKKKKTSLECGIRDRPATPGVREDVTVEGEINVGEKHNQDADIILRKMESEFLLTEKNDSMKENKLMSVTSPTNSHIQKTCNEQESEEVLSSFQGNKKITEGKDNKLRGEHLTNHSGTEDTIMSPGKANIKDEFHGSIEASYLANNVTERNQRNRVDAHSTIDRRDTEFEDKQKNHQCVSVSQKDKHVLEEKERRRAERKKKKRMRLAAKSNVESEIEEKHTKETDTTSVSDEIFDEEEERMKQEERVRYREGKNELNTFRLQYRDTLGNKEKVTFDDKIRLWEQMKMRGAICSYKDEMNVKEWESNTEAKTKQRQPIEKCQSVKKPSERISDCDTIILKRKKIKGHARKENNNEHKDEQENHCREEIAKRCGKEGETRNTHTEVDALTEVQERHVYQCGDVPTEETNEGKLSGDERIKNQPEKIQPREAKFVQENVINVKEKGLSPKKESKIDIYVKGSSEIPHRNNDKEKSIEGKKEFMSQDTSKLLGLSSAVDEAMYSNENAKHEQLKTEEVASKCPEQSPFMIQVDRLKDGSEVDSSNKTTENSTRQQDNENNVSWVPAEVAMKNAENLWRNSQIYDMDVLDEKTAEKWKGNSNTKPKLKVMNVTCGERRVRKRRERLPRKLESKDHITNVVFESSGKDEQSPSSLALINHENVTDSNTDVKHAYFQRNLSQETAEKEPGNTFQNVKHEMCDAKATPVNVSCGERVHTEKKKKTKIQRKDNILNTSYGDKLYTGSSGSDMKPHIQVGHQGNITQDEANWGSRNYRKGMSVSQGQKMESCPNYSLDEKFSSSKHTTNPQHYEKENLCADLTPKPSVIQQCNVANEQMSTLPPSEKSIKHGEVTDCFNTNGHFLTMDPHETPRNPYRIMDTIHAADHYSQILEQETPLGSCILEHSPISNTTGCQASKSSDSPSVNKNTQDTKYVEEGTEELKLIGNAQKQTLRAGKVTSPETGKDSFGDDSSWVLDGRPSPVGCDVDLKSQNICDSGLDTAVNSLNRNSKDKYRYIYKMVNDAFKDSALSTNDLEESPRPNLWHQGVQENKVMSPFEYEVSDDEDDSQLPSGQHLDPPPTRRTPVTSVVYLPFPKTNKAPKASEVLTGTGKKKTLGDSSLTQREQPKAFTANNSYIEGKSLWNDFSNSTLSIPRSIEEVDETDDIDLRSEAFDQHQERSMQYSSSGKENLEPVLSTKASLKYYINSEEGKSNVERENLADDFQRHEDACKTTQMLNLTDDTSLDNSHLNVNPFSFSETGPRVGNPIHYPVPGPREELTPSLFKVDKMNLPPVCQVQKDEALFQKRLVDYNPLLAGIDHGQSNTMENIRFPCEKKVIEPIQGTESPHLDDVLNQCNVLMSDATISKLHDQITKPIGKVLKGTCNDSADVMVNTQKGVTSTQTEDTGSTILCPPSSPSGRTGQDNKEVVKTFGNTSEPLYQSSTVLPSNLSKKQQKHYEKVQVTFRAQSKTLPDAKFWKSISHDKLAPEEPSELFIKTPFGQILPNEYECKQKSPVKGFITKNSTELQHGDKVSVDAQNHLVATKQIDNEQLLQNIPKETLTDHTNPSANRTEFLQAASADPRFWNSDVKGTENSPSVSVKILERSAPDTNETIDNLRVKRSEQTNQTNLEIETVTEKLGYAPSLTDRYHSRKEENLDFFREVARNSQNFNDKTLGTEEENIFKAFSRTEPGVHNIDDETASHNLFFFKTVARFPEFYQTNRDKDDENYKVVKSDICGRTSPGGIPHDPGNYISGATAERNLEFFRAISRDQTFFKLPSETKVNEEDGHKSLTPSSALPTSMQECQFENVSSESNWIVPDEGTPTLQKDRSHQEAKLRSHENIAFFKAVSRNPELYTDFDRNKTSSHIEKMHSSRKYKVQDYIKEKSTHSNSGRIEGADSLKSDIGDMPGIPLFQTDISPERAKENMDFFLHVSKDPHFYKVAERPVVTVPPTTKPKSYRTHREINVNSGRTIIGRQGLGFRSKHNTNKY